MNKIFLYAYDKQTLGDNLFVDTITKYWETRYKTNKKESENAAGFCDNRNRGWTILSYGAEFTALVPPEL